MKRRSVLRTLAAMPLWSNAGRLYSAPMSGPRFLLVFLRGGYDCANVLVPYTSDDYYAMRPTIAIARPGSKTDATDAIALDSEWALTPALRGGIADLYQRGQALFIPFAGTSDLSRSHFETQDSIELGLATNDTSDSRSGFMGRLVAQLQNPRPIAFTDTLPLVFRGTDTVPNLSVKGIGKPVFDQRQGNILASMYADTPMYQAAREGLELRQQVAKALEVEMNMANRDAVTPKGFELEAERIATLMRDQYRIGFIDVGGWDTHVNQGSSSGTLASNLQSLDQGLNRFRESLGPEWDNTVVVVLSEFGRTFRENGDHGTDHGHGSVYWILGGKVNGGKVLGEQIAVRQDTLFQNRDFPVLNDYRAVLSGLFMRLWSLTASQVDQVFPQVMPSGLEII